MQLLAEVGQPHRIMKKRKKNQQRFKKEVVKNQSLDWLLATGILVLLALIGYRLITLYLESENTKKVPIQKVHRLSSALKSTHPLKAAVPIVKQVPEKNGVEIQPQPEPSYIASIENLPEERLTSEQPSIFIQQQQPPATKIVARQKQVKKIAILKAPVSRFTIQVMAADEKQALIAVTKQKKLGARYSIHNVHREHKSWYVLTFGEYLDYSTAKQAMKELPSWFQSEKPWIRSMQTIS